MESIVGLAGTLEDQREEHRKQTISGQEEGLRGSSEQHKVHVCLLNDEKIQQTERNVVRRFSIQLYYTGRGFYHCLHGFKEFVILEKTEIRSQRPG